MVAWVVVSPVRVNETETGVVEAGLISVVVSEVPPPPHSGGEEQHCWLACMKPRLSFGNSPASWRWRLVVLVVLGYAGAPSAFAKGGKIISPSRKGRGPKVAEKSCPFGCPVLP
jgi:hypothetical protein